MRGVTHTIFIFYLFTKYWKTIFFLPKLRSEQNYLKWNSVIRRMLHAREQQQQQQRRHATRGRPNIPPALSIPTNPSMANLYPRGSLSPVSPLLATATATLNRTEQATEKEPGDRTKHHQRHHQDTTIAPAALKRPAQRLLKTEDIFPQQKDVLEEASQILTNIPTDPHPTIRPTSPAIKRQALEFLTLL